MDRRDLVAALVEFVYFLLLVLLLLLSARRVLSRTLDVLAQAGVAFAKSLSS